MNNKGQSLVLFVVIIPIILLVIMAIVDIGKISLLKSSLDDINYMVIEYGLDNLDNPELTKKLEDTIKKNKSDIDNIEVNINNDKINIILIDDVDLVLLKNSNIFSVKSNYIGYIKNDKKIIERNK